MSIEIVKRLRSKSHEAVHSLKEGFPVGLREADEDDEEDTLDIDQEDINDEEDGEAPEELHPREPESRRSSSPSVSSSGEDDQTNEYEDEGGNKPLELEKDNKKDNVNPLDNPYAVKFTLGDHVALAYANGTSTDVEATIEGYDKEGFYRIKVDNGLTLNGITDLSLASLVKGTHENKCICGNEQFVTEGNFVVCDCCGRIRENLDKLSILDKSRPKGKKMIRSTPQPMSTSTKPNITDAVGESIKKAFKGKSKIHEEYDEEYYEDETDEEYDHYKRLKGKLDNRFWTRQNELKDDIEELGYEVGEINAEYVSVTADEYDSEYYIPLGGTSRTITLDFSRARML